MKRFLTPFLAAVLLASAGCQSLQVTPEQVAQLTNAVAQAQAAYVQLQPVIEAVAPLVQQALKDGETAGSDAARGRDSRWTAVRDAYFAAHPRCEICGAPAVDVHHKLSVRLHPAYELDPSNLSSLCRRDHFLFGHLCNWSLENDDIEFDLAIWKDRLAPGKEGAR